MPTPSHGLNKGSLYITGAALCWSLGGVLIKLVPWNAMAIAGIRSLIAFAVTVIFSRSFKITFTKTNILGGIALSGTAILFILANKYTTAANAIVLQYTAPVYIVLLSLIFFRKPVKRLDIAGILIILSGIVLFFFDDLSGGHLAGNILSLASGVFFALMFFINSTEGATPMEATRLGHLISAAIGIPFAFTSTGATLQLVPWLAVLAMGAIQLGLAYVLFAKGSPLVPPITASLISCIEPVLNPLWVMLVIGETPGFWSVIGMIVVICGVVIYNIVSTREGQKNCDSQNNSEKKQKNVDI